MGSSVGRPLDPKTIGKLKVFEAFCKCRILVGADLVPQSKVVQKVCKN